MRTLCRDCCETSEGAAERCPLCGSARLVVHAELDELAIAHVDCDAFYASVEKRDRPGGNSSLSTGSLPGAGTRFQPVWVEDVVAAVMRSLTDEATGGECYELGGPGVFRLRDICRSRSSPERR